MRQPELIPSALGVARLSLMAESPGDPRQRGSARTNAGEWRIWRPRTRGMALVRTWRCGDPRHPMGEVASGTRSGRRHDPRDTMGRGIDEALEAGSESAARCGALKRVQTAVRVDGIGEASESTARCGALGGHTRQTGGRRPCRVAILRGSPTLCAVWRAPQERCPWPNLRSSTCC